MWAMRFGNNGTIVLGIYDQLIKEWLTQKLLRLE